MLQFDVKKKYTVNGPYLVHPQSIVVWKTVKMRGGRIGLLRRRQTLDIIVVSFANGGRQRHLRHRAWLGVKKRIRYNSGMREDTSRSPYYKYLSGVAIILPDESSFHIRYNLFYTIHGP
jgi:hypothetical protein